jgi:hypothetical protein
VDSVRKYKAVNSRANLHPEGIRKGQPAPNGHADRLVTWACGVGFIDAQPSKERWVMKAYIFVVTRVEQRTTVGGET